MTDPAIVIRTQAQSTEPKGSGAGWQGRGRSGDRLRAQHQRASASICGYIYCSMPSAPAIRLRERLKLLVPFGLAAEKPRHFRDMLGVVWENRDNLAYAWEILSKGVCDGCALGVAGFHDWTIDGVHLCMTR